MGKYCIIFFILHFKSNNQINQFLKSIVYQSYLKFSQQTLDNTLYVVLKQYFSLQITYIFTVLLNTQRKFPNGNFQYGNSPKKKWCPSKQKNRVGSVYFKISPDNKWSNFFFLFGSPVTSHSLKISQFYTCSTTSKWLPKPKPSIQPLNRFPVETHHSLACKW